MFIIGRKPVLEFLRNNLKLKELYIVKDSNGKIIDDIQKEATKKNININYIDKKDVFKNIKNLNHQGVFAKTYDIDQLSFDELLRRFKNKSKVTILMLDKITDTHNFGAIIRTAEAFKVDAIIKKDKNSAPINETVIKTSMGAVFYIPICSVSNLNKALEKLKENNFITFSTKDSAEKSIYSIEIPKKSVIVIGSEEKGVSYMLNKLCDHEIRIPLYGKTNSLNASVATGILIYEFMKNRG